MGTSTFSFFFLIALFYFIYFFNTFHNEI